MLNSIKTHINCDFLGGGGSGSSIPPWTRTWNVSHNTPSFIVVVRCYQVGRFICTLSNSSLYYHTPGMDAPVLSKLPPLRLGDRDINFAVYKYSSFT